MFDAILKFESTVESSCFVCYFRLIGGIMGSDNESLYLEDLPMFLNSVLEKVELIWRVGIRDLSTMETGQCKTQTADCGLQTAYQGLNAD